MKSHNLPILYSFRRCPYAIRARLAIKVSNVQVEIREVLLKDKPKEMILISPKATVPVLELPDGTVIDESREIMLWALKRHAPENWLSKDSNLQDELNRLIDFNDNEFKKSLDHYKYADRFPEYPMQTYRQQGEVFLRQLEEKLSQNKFLSGQNISLFDMAIFPFIRQFAFVDKDWFDKTSYINLQNWLEHQLNSNIFHQVMEKYPRWQEGNAIQLLN